MIDVAHLGIEIDSRQAAQAAGDLDKLAASGARAEGSIGSAGKEWVRASSAAGKLRLEETSAAAAAERLARETNTAGRAAAQMARDAQASAGALKSAAVSAGASKAGMQQLSFQVGDVSQQFALGVKPMTIFVQQGGQVIQAVQLMTGGTSKLGAFLGGPWGIAIVAATTALVPLVGKLFEAEEALKEVEFASNALGDAQGILGSVMDLATGKINTQSSALLNLARAQAVAGRIDAQRQASDARAALREQAQGEINFFKPGTVTRLPNGQFIGAFSRDRDAADLIAGKALSGALSPDSAIAQLDKLAKSGTVAKNSILDALQAVANLGVAGENIKVFEELQKALEGDAAAAAGFLKETKGGGKGLDKGGGSGIDKETEALKKRVSASDEFIASLSREIEETGLNDAELRQLEIARARDAAVTDTQRSAIDELNAAREAAISTAKREDAILKDRDATAAFEARLRAIENETSLLGLVGPAREKAALQLEEETIKAGAASAGILDVEQAWQKYLETRTRGIDAQSALERDAEAAKILADQIGQLIGSLGRAGGIGGALGALIGLASGQVGAVGGQIGALLNTTIGTQTDKDGKLIARTIGDEIRDVFKFEGEFGQTMSRLLQGAGGGLLAGSALGFSSGASQLGSAIGGALGSKLTDSISKAIGGAAGQVLGTLAPVIGGALGAALGSVLAGTPKGGAVIGAVNGALGVSGTTGGNTARIAAATDSANAIIGSLGALAEKLGATIDATLGSVSIGIRGDNFRVDPTGGGNTKKKKGAIDFGQDAEAAALFAVQDLIRDGVLVGLRKGTEQLLKSASDIESGIEKALAFEGVFDQLEAIKDPIGAALSALEREFDGLRKIFEEAGATAEEYAQLEELLGIKRKEAIEEGAQRELEKLSERNGLEVQLLQLLGREQEALNLSRQFELATIESSLRPLKEMIFALEDANAVIERFEPLAADLKRFRDELLGGQGGGASFAFIRGQFQSTAGLAAQGDFDALSQLRGSASDFLAAAKENATSSVDFQRAFGEVLGAVDSGIFAADTQVDFAKLQIEAIDANRAEILKMREQLAAQQQTLVENSTEMRRLWERYEGDGLTIKSDQDTPIFVKTAPGDTVATA